MGTKILGALLLTPFISLSAAAQDLFLKLDSYSLEPNSRAVVRVLEGRFQGIEGAVTLPQYDGIGLHGPAFRGPAVESISLLTNKKTTTIEIQTLGAGTYLFGVSTVPKLVEQKAAAFNQLLVQDGKADILAQRRTNNELTQDVHVRLTNSVRTIFQVADKLSDHYNRRLTFPAELIPQQNPYSLRVGQTIAFLCLVDNRPIGNQFVTAGWESREGKIQTLSGRTAADGIVRFKLVADGKWYVEMNHMKALTKLNYEVKSASLTFAVRK
ncbi:MAG TPA: DUF4198 domain-containing protein [Pyrinomonadaceae bacterium]|nr:DUF4198 domain-containing protein [Pyrinomonadaceae bacterium]